jgi:hypothetical protein
VIGIAEIRRYAMALPEVSEAKHFKLPAFKVRDKSFVVIQKGSTHAIVSVDETQAAEAAARDPHAYQVLRRNDGRIFVGVRVDLAKASGARVRDLIEQAWRHKAPKGLSAATKVSRR